MENLLPQKVKGCKFHYDLLSYLKTLIRISIATTLVIFFPNLLFGAENKPVDTYTTNARQQKQVTGKVVDEKQLPLTGVTVRLQGSSTRTIFTDKQGNYTFQGAADTDSLKFSYVGYKTQSVVVGSRKIINVTLVEADNNGLDEVVVVAYGTQKKITTIGAQSSVKVEDLKQPIANLSNAIAGRIAGVIGVQRSGEPGYDGSEIYIRGISTFTNAGPLVLVDGIERSFSNIDPEDIASFTILKDASATAVYGVRGANGVILIESKRGKVGPPQFNMLFNQGITQFTRTPEFADGVTYMQMANEAYRNTNPNAVGPLYSDQRIQMTASGADPDIYPNVDWVKELFKKNAQNRRANLNASGGSERTQYYLSLGYYDETGLYKTDEFAKYNSTLKFTRYNFTSNLNIQLFKNTKIDFGASGWISDGNFPGKTVDDIWSAALTMSPIVIPPRYSNGQLSQPATDDVLNPYALLTQTGYVGETKSQLWSNIRVTQNLSGLLKGLSLYGLFSFDNYNQLKLSRTKTEDAFIANGRDIAGNLITTQTRVGSSYLGYGRENGGTRQFYTEAALNYSNSFGKNDVSALMLFNQSDKSDAFAGDFVGAIPIRYQGIAARATYAYDNRYLAEANLGYNGSETFVPGKQFGFFPSFGIGWVASQEKFFKSIENFVQFLKFRASYGIVGNSALGGRRFGYITTIGGVDGYTFGQAADNGYGGIDIGEYAVNVTWEKAKKLNIGMELKTWQNAVSLVVDVFKENRSGIFLRRSGDLPDYMGIRNSPYGNLGEVHNRGVDATVTLNKKLSEDWSLEFRGNLTWNKAIVVEDAAARAAYDWRQTVGRKVGQRFGKTALGLFQSMEEIANSPTQVGTVMPGDIKFKDLNGDGKIDSFDESPIGNGSIPAMVYGFGPSISFKGFSIGAWIKGISSVDITLNGEGLQPYQKEGIRGNVFSNIIDRWTPDGSNPNPVYPRLAYPSTVNANYDNSTWWVRNGAFLRLQNVEASYTFKRSSNWMKNVGLTNFRIYAIGYNLATLTKFKMWDVELGDGRGARYPLIKTFNLGIDCRF